MEHEQEYTGLLLGTGSWRQRLAPILCSAPDKSFTSLAAACHRHLAARALALVARPDALAAQPSLYILHTKSAQPVPGVTPLSDPQLVPPALAALDLRAYTWTWDSISTGSPTFLPLNAAAPTIAACGSVMVSLQLRPGVRAEFSYWRAYLLQEQALGVAITGIASNGGNGRGNLTLTLSEHHGANGARRLFRLSGFSLASAAMNGLWKNDAVSAEKKEQQWIRLTVQSETAAAAVAEVLGPGHRVVAVYNLNKQEWVDHLVLQRVVREGGGKLSQQELSAVMAEVCEVPLAAPADAAHAASGCAAGGPAAGPAPAPVGAGLLEQEVQLLQVRLEGVGMQQQGLARLADTHSHLHQCSHTRLCELEESQEQHKAMLAEHSSQLTDLQAIWEREQRKHNPGHASCGEGESGAGQPGEALPGRKRARQEGGSQQAAAAGLSGGLVSQPAVGSAAGGWAAMEKEDMAASAWVDELTGDGPPLPAAAGPTAGHGMAASTLGASSHQARGLGTFGDPHTLNWELPDVPAADSLELLAALRLPTLAPLLQQPVVEFPASPMPTAAADGAVAPAPRPAGALLPSTQSLAAQQTEHLLATLSLDPLGPAPVARLPSREDIKQFLAIHCLSPWEARTTAQLVDAVQQACPQIRGVQAGMQLFKEVQLALLELRQQRVAAREEAASSSAVSPEFSWHLLAAGQHG